MLGKTVFRTKSYTPENAIFKELLKGSNYSLGILLYLLTSNDILSKNKENGHSNSAWNTVSVCFSLS